jgi:hypothetical protein
MPVSMIANTGRSGMVLTIRRTPIPEKTIFAGDHILKMKIRSQILKR